MTRGQGTAWGDIYALVVIPHHLERDAREGSQPRVTVFNNGQFILIAKLVNSALAQVVGTLNGQVGCWRPWPTARRCPVPWDNPVPIASQVTALYNINSSYAQFLLSALLPAVWQILVVLYGLNAWPAPIASGWTGPPEGLVRPLAYPAAPRAHRLGWGLAWSCCCSRGLGTPCKAVGWC